MDMAGESQSAEQSHSPPPDARPSPRHVQFWVLFIAQILALAYALLAAFAEAPDVVGVEIGFGAAAIVYAAIVSAAAVGLSPVAGFALMPLFEKWRVSYLKPREAVSRFLIAIGIALIACYAAISYEHLLMLIFGHWKPVHLSKVVLNVPAIISSAVAEEILFRGATFPLLVIAADYLWRRPELQPSTISIWTGNLVQAFIFGLAHVLAGLGPMRGWPWYVRAPLAAQTWVGLLLGCVYLRYGLETACVCHASYDLFVLAMARHLIPRPFGRQARLSF